MGVLHILSGSPFGDWLAPVILGAAVGVATPSRFGLIGLCFSAKVQRAGAETLFPAKNAIAFY